MAKLKDKLQNALDEARILILGSSVLLGFQMRAVFESSFSKLPDYVQLTLLGGLVAIVLNLILLMTPATVHQRTYQGEDTEALHYFTIRLMGHTLVFITLGMAANLFVAAYCQGGLPLAVTSALIGAGLCFLFWYGLEFWHRKTRPPRPMHHEHTHTAVTDKIRHVLTEARMVLPGAQALLGFQFITFLMQDFGTLPLGLRQVHLISLYLVCLSIILLMTPAAYHRIVEQGEETEEFHIFASRCVLAAMVPLMLGICGDVYVVARKVTDTSLPPLLISFLLLCVSAYFWFILPIRRRQLEKQLQVKL